MLSNAQRSGGVLISKPLSFRSISKSRLSPWMSIQRCFSNFKWAVCCVCACVVLTSLFKDWYKSALKLEILDPGAHTAFSIAFDVVKSNSVALQKSWEPSNGSWALWIPENVGQLRFLENVAPWSPGLLHTEGPAADPLVHDSPWALRSNRHSKWHLQMKELRRAQKWLWG